MNKITLLLFLIIYNLSFSQQKDYEAINTSVNSKFAELGATFLNNNTVVFASSKKVDDDKNFIKYRRKNNSQSFLEFYIGTITENGDILETGKFSNEIKNKFFEADITFSQDLKTVYFTWNNFYSIESKEDVEKWKTLRIVKATINENFETSNIVFLPFNSDKYSVRSPILSNNGKKLFFVSDMPGGYGESDIYYVDILNDGTYGTPVNLGPNINSAYSEQYPTIDANSNLYFSTIGNSGMGGLDIFKSEFKNGEYQKAQNLPEPINSKFDDFGFIYNSTTSTGYFTSNRKDGIGNVDIYAFVPKEIICAQEIVFNFINEITKKEISNVTISLTTDIENIEVLSDSKNSTYKTPLKCNTKYKLVAEKENYLPFETFITTNDILNKKIVETFKLTPLDCNQVVEVHINFEGKKEIIESGNVLIVDNKGSVITQPINDNHLISFKANCNTSYKIVANAKNYNQSEIEFTTDGTFNKQLKKEITLTKTPCFQKIAGTVKSIQNLPVIANVSLIVDGKLIEKQMTDNFSFNVNCNTSYILLAEANNYNSNEILVKTGEALNTVNNISISLKPKLCNQKIEIIAFNKETNQQLKNSKISIYSNNNLLDEKYIVNNNTLIFNADCDTNYKIIGEAENFESDEIEFNTDATFGNSTTQKLFLTPIECNQSLNGNLVSESTNFEIKNATVSLFSNNILIEQKEVTTLNTFSFSLNCNTSYNIIASATNFENSEMVFETNTENDVTIEKTITLSPKKCKQKFEVIVFNKQTNQQLKNTKISIYSNNNLLDEKYIVNTNTLIFNAECNTNYKIIAESENFEVDEIEFNTDLTYDASSTKQLFLTPKPCNQNLLISIFNKETKEPLFGSKLIVYKNNEILKTHSLLNEATFNLELSCDTNYNLKIELEKFDTQLFEFQTTNMYNSQLVKDIYLTPSIEYVTLGGQKLINTNNIYFDLDKDNIRPDASIELNKVISYLVNNPEVKIEVKSHTDSRAPDNYNLKLSEGRAASVMSYIISKGIDASRVTGKGYGETQLINNCANGVKCTEAEHQLNRRTEFVIIE